MNIKRMRQNVCVVGQAKCHEVKISAADTMAAQCSLIKSTADVPGAHVPSRE